MPSLGSLVRVLHEEDPPLLHNDRKGEDGAQDVRACEVEPDAIEAQRREGEDKRHREHKGDAYAYQGSRSRLLDRQKEALRRESYPPEEVGEGEDCQRPDREVDQFRIARFLPQGSPMMWAACTGLSNARWPQSMRWPPPFRQVSHLSSEHTEICTCNAKSP